MPWELIGSCGSGQDWQLQLGMTFLSSVFEEPEGCELDIMYTDCEFADGTIGAYGSIGLLYEEHIGGLSQFAARCQDVLWSFSTTLDWSKITPEAMADRYHYQLGPSGRLKVLDDEAESDEEEGNNDE